MSTVRGVYVVPAPVHDRCMYYSANEPKHQQGRGNYHARAVFVATDEWNEHDRGNDPCCESCGCWPEHRRTDFNVRNERRLEACEATWKTSARRRG